MKKYIISALIYALSISVIVGVVDVCFGNTFIEGFLPLPQCDGLSELDL